MYKKLKGIERIKFSLKNYWFIYLLIIPGLLSLLVYSYGPMLLQFVLAFTDYNFADGIFGSKFVGFQNFVYLFSEMPDFWRIFGNTMLFSLLDFIFGFIPPIILAIILFHLNNDRFRRFSQGVLYIPHFFSWVIVYSIAYGMLSNTGMLNSVLNKLFGISYDFLTSPKAVRVILYVFSVWKGIGWGSLMDLAAMQNIDPSLYEAARIDGCGPWRRISAVTLPGIRGVLIYQLIFVIGGIFVGGNTEEILLFYSPAVRQGVETVNTWLYNYGLMAFEYSPGAALSLVQSLMGMILVLGANKFMSKKFGVSIW